MKQTMIVCTKQMKELQEFILVYSVSAVLSSHYSTGLATPYIGQKFLASFKQAGLTSLCKLPNAVSPQANCFSPFF